MSRRQFLAAVGAASFGSVLPLAMRRLERVGLQLYTVRYLLQRDFSGTLAQIAAIGYREVEFAGYFERPPAGLRRLLARYRLTAPAGHFPKEALLGPSGEVFDAAALVGHRWVIVAWIPPEERRTLDGWRRIADDLNRIGERARRAGLQFAYHNQDVDFIPIQGMIPYDTLLAATDPRLVDLEIDLYWVAKGGQDPAAYLARTAGRTRLVHVKDSGGPPAHAMVDVGKGALDWKHLLGTAWRAGVRHYFVEHDEPADPLDFCRSSYAYLSRLEF